MSGITPILDTLLHQVLGKRVDIPVLRDQPAPVSPKASFDAIQPARSDSRLHGQSQPRLIAPEGDLARSATGRQALLTSERAAPLASAQTSLSRAAVEISQLLARHPVAQSSTITAASALLSARNPSAESVASALANSISGSGVFYESHLSRWLQGSYPMAKLWQEPQAWMGLSFRPTPQPQAAFSPLLAAWRSLLLERPGASSSGSAPRGDGHAGGASSMASAAARGGVSTTPASASPAGTSPSGGVGAYRADGTQVAARPAAGVTASSPLGGGTQVAAGEDSVLPRHLHQLSQQPPEHLQSLVRHQLELMASPTLRWEGQLLPGMPMFFMLTEMPYHESHEQSEGSGEREQSQRQWRGEIRLTLPRLGEIEVELESVAADHWRIVIAAGDAQAQQRIVEALPALREQLNARQLRVDLDMAEEKRA